MSVLLALAITLLLAVLPRLLPTPATYVLAAAPAEAMAQAMEAKPSGAAARPDNLLYFPVGLHPAERCLHGPLVVTGRVRIRPPLQFWRISAGEIRFGDCSRAPSGIQAISVGRRHAQAGEYRLKAGVCLKGDLAVQGDLYLERFSSVLGSVQASGGVWMDEGAEVAGAVIAHGSVRVGRRSRIAGPLMSKRSISLARECVIGAWQAPTSVSAARVRIHEGCKVYGQVLAEEGAQVNALAGADARPPPL